MIGWFVLGTAQAQSVQVPVSLCFDYDTHYQEATPGGIDAPGDHWVNSDVDRPVRWLYIEVETDQQTVRAQLDRYGCATLSLDFGAAPYRFDVTLESKGKARGTVMELRNNNYREFPSWWGASLMKQTWVGNEALPGGSTHTYVIDASDGWQLLAASMRALHLNGWRLAYGPNRSCCTKEAAGEDGTCTDPTYLYQKVSAPYGPAGQQFIPILADNGWSAPYHPQDNDRSNDCCASKLPWYPQDPVDDYRSGVWTGDRVQKRFSITHELGHVVVGIRMGGFEANQYPLDAPLDGCSADFHEYNSQAVDVGARGIFQKEYTSTGFREGWANFFAAWMWNDVSDADVHFDSTLVHDYDLDGDLDNDAPGWGYRGTHRLAGDPVVPNEPNGTPAAAWVQGLDESWLGRAIANSPSCERVQVGMTSGTCPTPLSTVLMERDNRTTIFDVSSFFWALYTEEGLSPNELSDLYVDACPRAWRKNDSTYDGLGSPGVCSAGDDLPWNRIGLSADFNALDQEVASQADWVQH